MEQYHKLNASAVRPYKITLIKRDDKDASGATSRTVVQELLTQDNVDVLAGWVYSPNAIASAPIISAGKKLAVIMNAGTAHITQMSPYFVRASFSMWHAGYGMGEAEAKQLGAKTAVVGYSDFPPGKDMLASFKRSFEATAARSSTKSRWAVPMRFPTSRRSSRAQRRRSRTCSSCSCRRASMSPQGCGPTARSACEPPASR
jgi:branched-chain amino acid transport system substrate-binding protein